MAEYVEKNAEQRGGKVVQVEDASHKPGDSGHQQHGDIQHRQADDGEHRDADRREGVEAEHLHTLDGPGNESQDQGNQNAQSNHDSRFNRFSLLADEADTADGQGQAAKKQEPRAKEITGKKRNEGEQKRVDDQDSTNVSPLSNRGQGPLRQGPLRQGPLRGAPNLGSGNHQAQTTNQGTRGNSRGRRGRGRVGVRTGRGGWATTGQHRGGPSTSQGGRQEGQRVKEALQAATKGHELLPATSSWQPAISKVLLPQRPLDSSFPPEPRSWNAIRSSQATVRQPAADKVTPPEPLVVSSLSSQLSPNAATLVDSTTEVIVQLPPTQPLSTSGQEQPSNNAEDPEAVGDVEDVEAVENFEHVEYVEHVEHVEHVEEAEKLDDRSKGQLDASPKDFKASHATETALFKPRSLDAMSTVASDGDPTHVQKGVTGEQATDPSALATTDARQAGEETEVKGERANGLETLGVSSASRSVMATAGIIFGATSPDLWTREMEEFETVTLRRTLSLPLRSPSSKASQTMLSAGTKIVDDSSTDDPDSPIVSTHGALQGVQVGEAVPTAMSITPEPEAPAEETMCTRIPPEEAIKTPIEETTEIPFEDTMGASTGTMDVASSSKGPTEPAVVMTPVPPSQPVPSAHQDSPAATGVNARHTVPPLIRYNEWAFRQPGSNQSRIIGQPSTNRLQLVGQCSPAPVPPKARASWHRTLGQAPPSQPPTNPTQPIMNFQSQG